MDLMNDVIEKDVWNRLYGLLRRTNRTFGAAAGMPAAVADGVCRWFVTALRGDNNAIEGQAAGMKMLQDVVDPAEWQDGTAFWCTALGRSIGWWTGGSPWASGAVSRTAASSMLDVGRQGVAKAVDNGRLIAVGETRERVGGLLLASSVRDEMRRRFPHEIQSGVPGITPTLVGGDS